MTRFGSKLVLTGPKIVVLTGPSQIKLEGLGLRSYGPDLEALSFISKTLSPAERKYEIYDREILAIIRALEEWQHYIQGSAHTTVILSDHKNLTYYREAKNLTYYREAKKLNRRQARWSLYLSEFDVKLVQSPGNKMVQSDALSRRPITKISSCFRITCLFI